MEKVKAMLKKEARAPVPMVEKWPFKPIRKRKFELPPDVNTMHIPSEREDPILAKDELVPSVLPLPIQPRPKPTQKGRFRPRKLNRKAKKPKPA